MPKISYIDKKFGQNSQIIIRYANEIIASYIAQGYKLTLRQLYYQFVSRGLIPNNVKEYARLGRVVNDARLAGYIDWDAIEDRTRNLASRPHWSDPAEIVEIASRQYAIDKWGIGQRFRIEVWIEKEALAGVFERVCTELDVPFLCCRGYTSQSEMWNASQRLLRWNDDGQKICILHFGDHDPSGIDMSRDIQDRLSLFGCSIAFERLALNMDQVQQYNPPPNPAKETDSRFQGYIYEFGHESWELDALEPQVLANLVRNRVFQLRDPIAWDRAVKREENERKVLENISNRWDDVESFLKQNKFKRKK